MGEFSLELSYSKIKNLHALKYESHVAHLIAQSSRQARQVEGRKEAGVPSVRIHCQRKDIDYNPHRTIYLAEKRIWDSKFAAPARLTNPNG